MTTQLTTAPQATRLTREINMYPEEAGSLRPARVLDTNVWITAREVYGKRTFYPANEQAERLCKLAGTKTFTVHSIGLVLEMGFSVLVCINGTHEREVFNTRELF